MSLSFTTTRPILFTAAILALTASGSRAEESVLKLVPKDAIGFIHIRAGDIWKHDSLKAVREFLTKTEPELLRKFEREVGFRPGDVESVTLIFPEFSESSSNAPLIVVRMEKPFDKAKLLNNIKAVSPGEPMYGKPMSPPRYYPKPVPSRKMNGIPPPPAFKKEIEDFPKKELKEDKFEIAFKGAADEEPESDPDDLYRPKPDLRGQHYIWLNHFMHFYIVDERTVVVAKNNIHSEKVDPLIAYCAQMLRNSETGPLSEALALALKKHTVVAALNVSAVARSLPARLPPDLERFQDLLSAKLALLTVDFGNELQTTVSIEANDAASAKKIKGFLEMVAGLAKDALPELKDQAKKAPVPELAQLLLGLGEKALTKAEIVSKESMVQFSTSIPLDDGLSAALMKGFAQAQIAGQRSQHQSDLRQIGIALFTQQDAFGQMKFGVGGKDGSPNLSWRVSILPFIDQAGLYDQFKLDEPWDSEHNKKLIEKMPKIYAPPKGVKAEKGHTFLQTFVGPDAIQPIMIVPRSFPDGAATTILVIEAGEAVPWTRPDNMQYDPKKPLPKVGGHFGGDFNVLLGDGSVHYIRKSIPEKVLRALITPAGGDVVDWSWDK